VALSKTMLGLALASVVLGSGCAAGRSALAQVEPERERSVVLADGVSVRATRWDRLLVVRAAAADDSSATSAPPSGRERDRDEELRRARLDRFQARYGRGTVFTVLVELAHADGTDDPLADPATWWFHLSRGGRSIAAREVEVLAVDRFPTGAARTRASGRVGKAQRRPPPGADVHLRIALRVAFDDAVEDGPVTMRLGSRARTKRRYALGPLVARRGTALRWSAIEPD
jgi:hypothetical protein